MAYDFKGKNQLFLTEYEPFPGKVQWKEYKTRYGVPRGAGDKNMSKVWEGYKSKVEESKVTEKDMNEFTAILDAYIKALKDTQKKWDFPTEEKKQQVYAELAEILRRCKDSKPKPSDNPDYNYTQARKAQKFKEQNELRSNWNKKKNKNEEVELQIEEVNENEEVELQIEEEDLYEEVELQIEEENLYEKIVLEIEKEGNYDAPPMTNTIEDALARVEFSGEKENDKAVFAGIRGVLVPSNKGFLHRDKHITFLDALIASPKVEKAYRDPLPSGKDKGKKRKVDILRDLEELLQRKVYEARAREEKAARQSKVVGKSKFAKKSINIKNDDDEEEFWA